MNDEAIRNMVDISQKDILGDNPDPRSEETLIIF